ncbi:LAFA_0D10352g1_1 [Lachancea sp. 'fantastica']|nr:LAFA_0D10352g1_1 [Lachancea sp. 'fantastica']
MATLIETTCLLLHCFCFLFLSIRNETPKLNSMHTHENLVTPTTFEIGQLSRFLLDKENHGQSLGICFHEWSKAEVANQFSRKVNTCLVDIKNRKALGSFLSEEEVILDYYNCLLRAELSYLRKAKRSQFPFELELPTAESAMLFKSKAASFIMGLFFLTWMLSSTTRLEQLREKLILSRCRPLKNLRISGFRPSMGQLSRFGSKIIGKYRELNPFSKLEANLSERCSFSSFGETRVDGKTPEARDKVQSHGKEADVTLKNEELTNVVDTGIALKEVSINLMPKNRALVFDLTTKEGRKEWKTYISRDKFKQIPQEERTCAHHNLTANGVTSLTDPHLSTSLELDASLENVPLYDKHGKPLRRVCVPGIGWISRRKYLEQRA